MNKIETPCSSEQGHSIQASVTGHGHFVCVRCWHRFICPACLPGLERWFSLYCCHEHVSTSVDDISHMVFNQ